MRRHIFILALTACSSESAEERLDRLVAESDTLCWSHYCSDGPGNTATRPAVPVEQGVACMNDALARGARAVAVWTDEDFARYTTTITYLFTVDGQVEVMTKKQFGEDPFVTSPEVAVCTGPVQVGPAYCVVREAPGQLTTVNAPALDGCAPSARSNR